MCSLAENCIKQRKEWETLAEQFRSKFKIEDEEERKISIGFVIRSKNIILNVQLPHEYPSLAPPSYTINVDMSAKQKKEIKVILYDIYKERFGETLLKQWVFAIMNYMINTDIEEDDTEQNIKQNTATQEVVEDTCADLGLYEGKMISDRQSYFLPYYAKVTSENDVRRALEKIESKRKVSGAWRNTYAYRFISPNGKLVEVPEDGGEPKAGRNLLIRMINYEAQNSLVYISRRIGGSKLGADRFKHLNNAADDVLFANGYSGHQESSKSQNDANNNGKKNKKGKKGKK